MNDPKYFWARKLKFSIIFSFKKIKKEVDSDSLFHKTDLRIQIKMKRIRNTDFK